MNKQSLAYASQTTPGKQQLTDIEIARYLNVCTSTVRRWRLRGGGPRWIRIEGSIRYPLVDLEAYVASLPSGGGALLQKVEESESADPVMLSTKTNVNILPSSQGDGPATTP